MKYLVRHKIIFINSLLFSLSLIFLIFPAIINGYPLVYSDSGAYIASGFDNHVPVDRPIMYAFFVRHISMARSLWFVIIMQAIVITTILLISFKCFLNSRLYFLYAFISVVLLSISTGISNYTSQIMPDIFSSIAIIGLCLLLSFPDFKKSSKILLGVLMVFSCMAHSSNLMTITLVTITVMLIRLLFRNSIPIKIKQIYLVLSLVLTSWVLVPSMNYMLGAGFKVSRAPNIFIMGRLVESGILNIYLHDKCDNNNIQLCKYINNLPATSSDFLWNTSSPLYDEGNGKDCWLLKNEKYDPIVKDIFTTPKYILLYAHFAIVESWNQLLNFEVDDLVPMMENSPVLVNISWRYEKDYNQYINTKQAHHPFTSRTISFIQNIVIAICLIFLLGSIALKKIRKNISSNLKIFITVAFSGLICNAIICATFSIVANRFQGRVIWLIPLIVGIIIISNFSRKELPKQNE